MKKKEQIKLAKQIAINELILANSTDEAEISAAKEEILRLSKKMTSLEDIFEVDLYVQEILKNS